jgi:hypothetical protein
MVGWYPNGSIQRRGYSTLSALIVISLDTDKKFPTSNQFLFLLPRWVKRQLSSRESFLWWDGVSCGEMESHSRIRMSLSQKGPGVFVYYPLRVSTDLRGESIVSGQFTESISISLKGWSLFHEMGVQILVVGLGLFLSWRMGIFLHKSRLY